MSNSNCISNSNSGNNIILSKADNQTAAHAPDTPNRKKLKRDINREALTRLEESARTIDEFRNVESKWDRLDDNRERKERYWEQLISSDMFDWDFEDFALHYGGPISYDEDFLDIIYHCICQMHNLTHYQEISMLVNKATTKQKEAFFTKFLAGCSTEKISKCYGTSDRNVRKHISKMVGNIRRELYSLLAEKAKSNIADTKQEMTPWEYGFLDRYIGEYGERES